MQSRVLACLLVACVTLPGLSQTPELPKLRPPTETLSSQQWKLLNASLVRKQPVVALEIVKTNFKDAFPGTETNNSRGIYSNPPSTVTFRAAFDNLPSEVNKVALQFSSSPASFDDDAPYTGWKHPSGILAAYDRLNVKAVANPNPGSGSINLPIRPYDKASERVSASQQIATFSYTLPFPKVATAGTAFYARIVPIAEENGEDVAIGPSSNWVHFYVVATAEEKAIAEAKAKAEAENKLLVTKASEAQKAIRDNYEVRLLSYIPPKFSDDPGAADYFVAHSAVSIPYDKGKKVTSLARGQTYSLNYMKNLLDSNKTWKQELWEVTSAALNQQSSLFQEAKVGLVNGLTSSIEAASGVKVSNEVRAKMLQGVNFALVYCGIPPSLPNIDQLYNSGVDYLAATIADYALEQATGIAIDEFGANPMMTMAVRDAVRERAKTETAEMIRKLTKPVPLDEKVPETWGTPAPFFRRRPAMMYLEIRVRPGGKQVTGVTWQALELKFPGSWAAFEDIPSIALPRAVGDRLILPVALASRIPPQQWVVNGYMPHPHVAPGMEAGQPYYKALSDTNVMVITHHRLTGSGATFKAFMNSFQVKPHLVNARAIPEDAGQVQKPGTVRKALDENPVTLGPQNYYGRVKYWPFYK